MSVEAEFLSEIETRLHEAHAYAEQAAEYYERARLIKNLAVMRLCREVQPKLQAAIKCFADATVNPPHSLKAEFLRTEGLSLMSECDWLFFDIEHAMRKTFNNRRLD